MQDKYSTKTGNQTQSTGEDRQVGDRKCEEKGDILNPEQEELGQTRIKNYYNLIII